MKTRFPEHQLGKGTLGYKGETREYYASKRGLWAVTRWVVSGLLIVVGGLFLAASTAPVVDATVVSVAEQPPPAGSNLVVVRTPDGTVAAISMGLTSTPSVGSTTSVRELPFGRIAPDDGSKAGRSTGLLLLVAGLVMAAYSYYRVRHPKAVTTTVIAPDDAYDVGPHRGIS